MYAHNTERGSVDLHKLLQSSNHVMFKTVRKTYLFSFPIEFESFFQRSCEAVPRYQNLQAKVDVYSVKPSAEIRKADGFYNFVYNKEHGRSLQQMQINYPSSFVVNDEVLIPSKMFSSPPSHGG